MTGAMLSVLAVSMPSAAQRHWLPSRKDVSTSWISAMPHLTLSPLATRQHALHEAGVHATCHKLRISQHECLERQIAANSNYASSRDRATQHRQRGISIGGVRNDLRHQ